MAKYIVQTWPTAHARAREGCGATKMAYTIVWAIRAPVNNLKIKFAVPGSGFVKQYNRATNRNTGMFSKSFR